MRPQVKTILIKTIGRPEIGMGHVYRSLALSKELEKGFKVVFHVNDNPQVKALMQELGASFSVDEDIENLISRERIDLLLLDQLSNDEGLFQRLKSQFPHLRIVALDYFDYENEFVDAIINLFNHNFQKPKPDRDNVQYYEGLEYAIIRDEFQNYIPQERKTCQRVGKILVTFGGIDPKDDAKKVFQLLGMAGIRDVEVNVVFGPLWKGELPAAPTYDIHFHHSISASVMAKLMVETDLAFCGSGTTMLELLSVGTPAVVLPQNHLEERFALSVEQKRATKVIKDEAQQEDISYIRDLVTSSQERERLSWRGKSLVDGKGRERIHRIIASCVRGE